MSDEIGDDALPSSQQPQSDRTGWRSAVAQLQIGLNPRTIHAGLQTEFELDDEASRATLEFAARGSG